MNKCAHIGTRGANVGIECKNKANCGDYCAKHAKKDNNVDIIIPRKITHKIVKEHDETMCAHIGTRGANIDVACRNKAVHGDYCNKHNKTGYNIDNINPGDIIYEITDKICTKCNETKNSTAFAKNSEICKDCKRVKCTLCDATFAEERHLKRHHSIIHEKNQPFKCPNCPYATSQKSNLRIHKCPGKGEAYYQKLVQTKYKGGSKSTPAGIIDILTATELIEVKDWVAWKSALGQVLAYARFFPNHQKSIYFFGHMPSPAIKQVIIDTLAFYQINIIEHTDEPKEQEEGPAV